ncbi:MAG: 5-methylcytosine-specific restriction endonuclease McrA [Chloroflexi bacterium]|jgi:5-methylcytosine-specific restriction endonuclease McrA|nr:MAG: 5-methylcytosine-specific restriction endonuclease McrA [Chloroflexota bacterium]
MDDTLQNSDRWQQLRRLVFKSQENSCEDCGQHGLLELHHLTYRGSGFPRDGPLYTWETKDDVVGLCRKCHHQRHIDLNGDFWSDPEEMENHWSSFPHQMTKND